jgi:GTPase SAR1 family protein
MTRLDYDYFRLVYLHLLEVGTSIFPRDKQTNINTRQIDTLNRRTYLTDGQIQQADIFAVCSSLSTLAQFDVNVLVERGGVLSPLPLPTPAQRH